MFPSMFVFVHICLDQIADLHWVDLSALAVANLTMRNTRNKIIFMETVRDAFSTSLGEHSVSCRVSAGLNTLN